MQEFFDEVFGCIQQCDLDAKVVGAKQLYVLWQDSVWQERAWQTAQSQFNGSDGINYDEPGRPQKPQLVAPRHLPKRSLHTEEGRAALLHSIAHIEFNAINLALDAVYRFRGLPRQYYGDWLRVAAEEAYHFQLINEFLKSIGYEYGDFSAHNGLWDMAMRTKDDVMVRMAIVPRVMEARGLDATPGIMEKFSAAGDEEVVKILQIIMRDEIGHVEIGTRWFNYCCDKQKLPRQQAFEDLMRQYVKGRPKIPLHRSARISAGFTEAELEFLEGLT